MNITDISDPVIRELAEEYGTTDRLELIFARQRSLMEKYHAIEKTNNLLLDPGIPVNIHHPLGQARLKDFAWRFTEELGEASAALVDHPDIQLHAWEELADATHFLVELCILSGLSAHEVIGIPAEGESTDLLTVLFETAFSTEYEGGDLASLGARWHLASWHTTEWLARAMNCLKQKPWKQTHILTDEPRYESYLRTTFSAFASLLITAGLDSQAIFDLYFKKSEVNRFRVRSNY